MAFTGPSQIVGDLSVTGTLTAGTVTLPEGTVTDAKVSGSAAIGAAKLIHRPYARHAQAGTATAQTVTLHQAYAAGTIVQVDASVIVAAIGDATATVDVKKNGTTVLTAPIVLDSTNAAYVREAGTLDVTTYAAGDALTAVVTVAAGTGTLPSGLSVGAVLNENPS